MSKLLHRFTDRALALVCFFATLSLIVVPGTLQTNPAFGSIPKLPGTSLKPSANEVSHSVLPLSFELNRGQTNKRVKFLARSEGYVLFLTPTEAVMAIDNPAAHRMGKENHELISRTGDGESVQNVNKPPRSIVRMKLEGANPAPEVEGLERLTSTSNYFGGSDPRDWHTDIPSYTRVRYAQVYPGIDMVYYGDQRRLEYDFVLAPGSKPDCIQMSFGGIHDFEISRMGELLLHAGMGNIRQSKPVAYQETNGVKEEVDVSYVPNGAGTVGFQVGAYDPTRPLIIDPVLIYSTYLGGSGFDQGYAIAVDSFGNAYITGQTAAIDFPTTSGAFQTNYGGGDAFVAKLNPNGTALVYSTYLHGASGNGIAVDSLGNAYVTGDAGPTNFPTTAGAFQTMPMGYDAFVTKLNSSGSGLVYSARFGGNFDDFSRAIALDNAGNAYITGWTVCRSTNCTFPTVNAFQPNYAGGNNDAFVTKVDSSGATLVYSTYLGGGRVINGTEDWGEGIAVDLTGSAYVTGYTYSPDFPITSGAFDTTRAGLDAFVTKFAPSGATLVYSTFLGGAGREMGQGIAVDSNGDAFVTGVTESQDNLSTSVNEGFPVTSGAFQTQGSYDAFVTKINPQGSGLVYSTYLGGSAGVDRGWSISLDATGNAYVTGDTTSSNFPVSNPIQATFGGGLSDAFVTKVNATGSGLLYSTFLGGSLTDEGRGVASNSNGDAFVTGDTSSSDFPTANPLQISNGGGVNNHDDAFVVRIGNLGPTPIPTPTPTPIPVPSPVVPSLLSLSVNPSSVTGGNSSVGSVTLSSPASAGGAVVTIASSNQSLVVVPQIVNVGAGATGASFTISTNRVAATEAVEISASCGGTSRTALLTINPADVITIQRAEYQRFRRQLRIDATSTEPKAALRVYVTSSGAFIGALTNDGGGRFSARLSWPNDPKSITVRSSFGGSASSAVTPR